MKTQKTNLLQQLIEKGKFDYISFKITEKNFPLETIAETTPRLFYFGEPKTSSEVIKEMKKEGYRPANAYELINYASNGWSNKELIIALGSVAEIAGSRHVLCLGRFDAERYLRLTWRGGDWLGVCRFLAFRIDENETTKL